MSDAIQYVCGTILVLAMLAMGHACNMKDRELERLRLERGIVNCPEFQCRLERR
jgi:hypothetical protein